MSWNHRLVYFPRNKVTKLMEVFYDDNGLPWNCSDGAVLHDGVMDNDTPVLDAIQQQLNCQDSDGMQARSRHQRCLSRNRHKSNSSGLLP